VYRYRPPRRYFRYHRGGSLTTAQKAGLALGGAVVAAGLTGHAHAGTHHGGGSPAGAGAVAQAISYARAQLGKPYCWGGTGPGCYDCSGLVMEAYASAGVPIERTSEDQWATLRHVSRLRPGDLVFYPGADGTWASPGHVALYIGGGDVIQAFATGFQIMVSSLASASADAGGTVGYAQPGDA
jgi:cell wall-associated NlpC family hydrolase